MLPADHRRLIEKHQLGTLTDDEYQQYQELLRTDPSFYNDVQLHSLLTDTFRAENGRQWWAAVEQSRAKSRGRPALLRSVRYYPFAYVMAASFALLLVGIWLFWSPGADGKPQLVKLETSYLFGVTGEAETDTVRGYAGTDVPVSTLPVKWIRNGQLPGVPAYQYCRDTLTIFIENDRDTLYLTEARLRYNATTRALSVERPGRRPTVFRECQSAPQPF